MKKSIICILFLISNNFFAQVGINTITPNAQLEIKSSSQSTPSNKDGILIPKIDAFPVIIPSLSQHGILVFLTTSVGANLPGYYYWDNNFASWKAIMGWSLKGNSGTDSTINFIGTTDDKDLVFKRGNIIAGIIQQYNTGFGVNMLSSNLSGNFNTVFGAQSLNSNINGSFNSAVGSFTMSSNTSGNNNVSIGSFAFNSNTSGSDNTGVGTNSMRSNTIGSKNTAIGNRSMNYNISGNNNVAVGESALDANIIGNNNTSLGFTSLSLSTSGNENTAVGHNALALNTTGSNNVALGSNALYNSLGLITGSNNIGIGYYSEIPSNSASNQIRIGDTNITYAGIQVGWTITSDKRWKSKIKNSNLGLDFISKLRPVSYFRTNDINKKIEYGFIAQEVDQTLKDLNIVNSGIISKGDNGMLGVRYNDFISTLVKAVQEQQQIMMVIYFL